MTHGVFTVQFIRNGDSVTLYAEVKKAGDGSGMNLVQFWDSSAGAVTTDTDWSSSHESQQPIIYLRMRSANGYPITVKSVSWAYKGSTLYFPAVLPNTWTANTGPATYAGKFKIKLDENGIPCLRIASNLASADSLGNPQIAYTVQYETLGQESSISGSVDVWLRLASSKAVQLMLTSDRREISGDTPPENRAVITAVAYEGGTAMDLTDFTFKWYDADGQITGSLPTITVTRDMIQGREMIRCEMYKNASDTNYIAASAIDIWDIDDEYQVGHTPVANHNYCTPDNDAIYDVHLLKSGNPYNPAGLLWTWRVFNCAGVVTRQGGTGSRVTVRAADCEVNFNDISGQPVEESTFGDATVEVTASWTIS